MSVRAADSGVHRVTARGQLQPLASSGMSYTIVDLILFEPLFDPSMRNGTAYFELHPNELPAENACWLPGSLFLRDAAFDFFAECFHGASDTFDYFSFVRFGANEIGRLLDELTAYLGSLSAGPSREQLFAKYVSIFGADIWSGVATQPLAEAVLGAGNNLREFVESKTKDSECLWILGM